MQAEEMPNRGLYNPDLVREVQEASRAWLEDAASTVPRRRGLLWYCWQLSGCMVELDLASS